MSYLYIYRSLQFHRSAGLSYPLRLVRVYICLSLLLQTFSFAPFVHQDTSFRHTHKYRSSLDYKRDQGCFLLTVVFPVPSLCLLLMARHSKKKKKSLLGWPLVAHSYNPSYCGGRDQQDPGSKPVQADISRGQNSQYKRLLPVTQKVEHLPSKRKALSSNPSTSKKVC
jgi:hypothetical protein